MIETILAVLAKVGIEPTFLLAGLFGATARSIITKKKFNLETITTVFVGMLCAIYLTPAAIGYLALVDPAVINALAFGFGLVGLSVAEAFIGITTRFLKNPQVVGSFAEFLAKYLTEKKNSKSGEQPNDDRDNSDKPN